MPSCNKLTIISSGSILCSLLISNSCIDTFSIFIYASQSSSAVSNSKCGTEEHSRDRTQISPSRAGRPRRPGADSLPRARLASRWSWRPPTLPSAAYSLAPTAITACGKITKAGLYELDSDLIASSPSAGDCLVITASNVSLNLNHFDLLGATSAVGIHVMKTAARVFIEGNGSTIQTFGVGIQIDAPDALADNFTVLSNTDAGVVLNIVQQADLSNFSATNNKNDGVRIRRRAATTCCRRQ